MTPDQDTYAEFCEFRGETTTRLNDVEDRVDKINGSIEGLREDVKQNNNKITKLLGGLFVVSIIVVPFLAVFWGRIFNGVPK
jgi:uncharacterized phage infection (PIP) family protein YhgE